MAKEINIDDHTTAFIKKSIITPLLLRGVAFLEYSAKDTGRAQLINKILGDEALGTMHTLPLRNDIVLEMDVTIQNIMLYERSLQSFYYTHKPDRKLILSCDISDNEKLVEMYKQVEGCYKTHCYTSSELLDTFKDTVFEKTIYRIITGFLYRPDRKHILLRRYSFVENGILLEAGSGVTHFRVKVTKQGEYLPTLYRYEINKMVYFQSMESLGNYKEVSYLSTVYDFHNKEKYILNTRKLKPGEALSLMFMQTDILIT